MPNPFTQPITTLGETLGRGVRVQFGIYQSDRLFHMFVLGQTGTGKSTLLKTMMLQDLQAGRGFCLIDPHGDMAEEIAELLGENAIYWNAPDPDCPFGYNPLTYVAEAYRPLVASGIIEALKKQWSDAWGVRMEHLLRFAVLALLSRRGSSFADIVSMFTDKAFRRTVLQSVTDPEVLKFWNDEFSKMNYKNAFDGVAPIANKLGAFLSHPVVKKAICAPENPIRLRSVMDSGQPLIINLSKGRLGNDISGVLGGLILSMMAGAALSRENLPQYERRPFTVYVDEFGSFTTGVVAGMLSELRKYRVGLILAAQYLSGIKTSTLDAIFGNVGSLIVFRVGAQDAPVLSRQLGQIDPSDLINLPNYRSFTKLMVGGVQTKAFSAKTLKPVADRDTPQHHQ